MPNNPQEILVTKSIILGGQQVEFPEGYLILVGKDCKAVDEQTGQKILAECLPLIRKYANGWPKEKEQAFVA